MDGDGEHLGTPRYELANEKHRIFSMPINRTSGTAFDSQEAYRQGQPHYNFDVWALPELAEKASIAFPVDPDKALAAAAIRHAAISLLLPNDASSTGAGVELIVRAA